MHLTDILCLLTLVAGSVFPAVSTGSGLKTRITQKAIDFFTEARQIKSMLPDIPDVEDSTKIAVLGKVDYRVHSIKINSLQLSPSSFLTVEPDVGLRWRAEELKIILHGKWSYDTHSLIPISDKGAVTVKVIVNSDPFKLKLDKDSSGRLLVKRTVDACHFRISEVDIELSGGKEWLYNVFETNVEDMIKEAANGQICATVEKLIREDLAAALSSMEVIAPLIPDVANLDLSMHSSPVVVGQYIDLFHKGHVYYMVNDLHGRFDATAIPSDEDDTNMFYVWITDYVLNTAGFALRSSAYLQYTLTQAQESRSPWAFWFLQQIPENSTFILNTSGYEIGLLLPQVSKLYPDMEVQCNIVPTEPPSIKLTDQGVDIMVTSDIELVVIGEDSSPLQLIILENNMQMSLVLGVRGSNIIWDLSSFSCETNLIETEVENFDFVIVESAIKFACHAFIKQYIKDMGEEGVPLPDISDAFTLANPSITHGKGYIKLGFDLAG